jgi:hypothetical protein
MSDARCDDLGLYIVDAVGEGREALYVLKAAGSRFIAVAHDLSDKIVVVIFRVGKYVAGDSLGISRFRLT